MASTTYSSVDPAPIAGDDTTFKLIGGLAASCFIGALVTDIVYTLSPNFKWVTFSVWLITIGLLVAGLAFVVGLVARLARGRFALLGARWPSLLGYAAVVVVSIFNAFVHSRDAYEAVVPAGITLSAIAVVLLVLTPIVDRAYSRSVPTKASL